MTPQRTAKYLVLGLGGGVLFASGCANTAATVFISSFWTQINSLLTYLVENAAAGTAT